MGKKKTSPNYSLDQVEESLASPLADVSRVDVKKSTPSKLSGFYLVVPEEV